MEDTSVTATFIWTFEEAKTRQTALAGRGVLLTQGPITEVRVVSVLLIVVAIALIRNILMTPDVTFSTTHNPLSIALYVPPILLLMAVVFMLVKNNNLKRGFLRSPDSNKPVVVTFTSDEIIMKVDNVYETRCTWAVLTEVRRTPRGFCFFQTSTAGFWIPLHAFQSAKDADVISEMAGRLTPKYTVSPF